MSNFWRLVTPLKTTEGKNTLVGNIISMPCDTNNPKLKWNTRFDTENGTTALCATSYSYCLTTLQNKVNDNTPVTAYLRYNLIQGGQALTAKVDWNWYKTPDPDPPPVLKHCSSKSVGQIQSKVGRCLGFDCTLSWRHSKYS